MLLATSYDDGGVTVVGYVFTSSLWVDMVRRAPDEVRAPAASMAAFASWLSGDGAKAWSPRPCAPGSPGSPGARAL